MIREAVVVKEAREIRYWVESGQEGIGHSGMVSCRSREASLASFAAHFGSVQVEPGSAKRDARYFADNICLKEELL